MPKKVSWLGLMESFLRGLVNECLTPGYIGYLMLAEYCEEFALPLPSYCPTSR